jgi:hypothetical protein
MSGRKILDPTTYILLFSKWLISWNVVVWSHFVSKSQNLLFVSHYKSENFLQSSDFIFRCTSQSFQYFRFCDVNDRVTSIAVASWSTYDMEFARIDRRPRQLAFRPSSNWSLASYKSETSLHHHALQLRAKSVRKRIIN